MVIMHDFSRKLFSCLRGSSSTYLTRNQNATNLVNRSMWTWLNYVWNRVDKKRIEEVGPDKACAEWLLRCGAIVKWQGASRWQTTYTFFPPGSLEVGKIEEIDGTDSCIMHIGFEHLKGCKAVRKMILHKCYYVDDGALERLNYVANSLEHLQITSCGNVTDKGITSLHKLKKLTNLVMLDLPAVRNQAECVLNLKKTLPNCIIRTKEEKTE